jgi:quercetin dioxygenase-like cupin family protein
MYQFSFLLISLCFSGLLLLPANAKADSMANVLLTTSTSWNGGSFSYPDGVPEVTVVTLKMEEGDETGFHCHPVPAFAYIISGSIMVETASGEQMTLNAGDAMVEVMDTIHNGRAMGGPIELVAFYSGSKDLNSFYTVAQLEEDPEACGSSNN